jgi:hypothetical protein
VFFGSVLAGSFFSQITQWVFLPSRTSNFFSCKQYSKSVNEGVCHRAASCSWVLGNDVGLLPPIHSRPSCKKYLQLILHLVLSAFLPSHTSRTEHSFGYGVTCFLCALCFSL